MEAVMKSEIFFFVTTIAVIVITVLLAFVLVRFFLVLGDVRNISRAAKDEVDRIKADIQTFRTNMQTDGLRLVHIINFFKGLKSSKKSRINKSKQS